MMNKKMTIFYEYGNKLYINLTNRCCCACTFCLRQNGDSVGDADSLWLEHEPDMQEVRTAFAPFAHKKYPEMVFCGYGEPMMRLDFLLEVARFLKEQCPGILLRINTNGLADLIYNTPTAHKLQGLIDTVSISLNAYNKEEYLAVTRPKFGIGAYDAMLKYASDCKKYVPHVMFTVVDIIGDEAIQKSREVADSVGVPLRVRPMIK